MRNRDFGLAVILIILLILIVFSWALFIAMQQDTKDNDPVERGQLVFNNTEENFDYVDLGVKFIGSNRTGYGGGGSSSNKNRCTDDQVILRLFGKENTHAALWDQEVYEEKVCYNEIFGEMFEGKDVHECTGTNKVLGLIQEFNSHVEAPGYESGEYNMDVCYGDLECVARENSCSGTEKEIVALADYKNAHLESRDSDNYNILICCSSKN